MVGALNGCRTWMKLARICLMFLVAAHPAGTVCAEEMPDAGTRHHARLMALSLRIAQAQGNEGKIRRYKSLSRQQRGGKKPAAALFSPRETRASRPGRTP